MLPVDTEQNFELQTFGKFKLLDLSHSFYPAANMAMKQNKTSQCFLTHNFCGCVNIANQSMEISRLKNGPFLVDFLKVWLYKPIRGNGCC